MTLSEVATTLGTALGSALVALRGRDAWRRINMRRSGIPRCPTCGHRCVNCRRNAAQVSDPPWSERGYADDTTPVRGKKC